MVPYEVTVQIKPHKLLVTQIGNLMLYLSCLAMLVHKANVWVRKGYNCESVSMPTCLDGFALLLCLNITHSGAAYTVSMGLRGGSINNLRSHVWYQ